MAAKPGSGKTAKQVQRAGSEITGASGTATGSFGATAKQVQHEGTGGKDSPSHAGVRLVITEKAIAGRRIAEILAGKEVPAQAIGNAPAFFFECNGKPFIVVPLRGHIVDVDFPKQYSHWLGTDLKRLADAQIDYVATEHAIVSALRKVAKDADAVIVATDADREGEAIGREAVTFLTEGRQGLEIKRAYFSAITPKDIGDAFSKLDEFNYALADSADARREIDLIWGAVLTRFISLVSGRLGKEFLSAGRVQTPTLAIIVDREKERLAFKSHKYWEILALLEKDSKQFEALHKKGKFLKKEEAEAVLARRSGTALVVDVKSAKRTLARPEPFNTTAFLRAATALGMGAGEAMNSAETLYQQGYTSYPRTDNAVYPATLDLRAVLNELNKVPELKKDSEKILALGKLNPSRGKETKDHPPIYPVSAAPRGKLSEREWRIYELIARRFLATLSEDAETLNQTVDLEIGKEPFVAHGQVITKAGWKEVYPYSTIKETHLPELKKGDIAKVLTVEMFEKETQPPARYSQGSLIKLMEELGLGTKCLAAGTMVRLLNSPRQEDVKIEQLFGRLTQKKKAGNLDIAVNDSKCCVSFDGRKPIASNFAFVSRRSLKSGEKMFALRFADGSSVQATADHPFLIFSGNGLCYKPASQLKAGEMAVALNGFQDKNSGKSVSWNGFCRRLNKKSYLFSSDLNNSLKHHFARSGKSQRALAMGLSCSHGNFSSYLRNKRPVPLWLAKKLSLEPRTISSLNFKEAIPNPFPMSVDSAMARIIANLLADGSLDRSKVLSENCLDFRYHNTDSNLIERFRNDIYHKFGILPRVFTSKRRYPHKNIFYVRIPAVAGRIIATLYPSLLKKQIPAAMPKELYNDFIGAFFDDEGHASRTEQKIFISGKNHRMLRRLRAMLHELGISSSLDEKQHKLFIRGFHDLPLFLEKVPIHLVKKRQRIIDVLSEKYKYNRRSRPVFSFDKDILARLAFEECTSAEIASALGCSVSAVRNHLRRLLGKGLVQKHVYGNNKDIHRIIKYSSKQFTGSFYSLLCEKALSPFTITRKIVAVEPVDYRGYVYDITNNFIMPNFTLGNGVVVHNSTRHEIIKKLYSRQYISGIKSIEPNKISFAVIDVLEKYSPTVTKPKMTAELEAEMDLVAESKKTKGEVVGDSRKFLQQILGELVQNRAEIGTALRGAMREDSIMAKCPSCEGQLRVIMSRNRKRFLGCTSYPKCTTTFPLPQRGRVMQSDKPCSHCGKPMIKVFGGRYRYEMCVDPNCISKADWGKKKAEREQAKAEKDAALSEQGSDGRTLQRKFSEAKLRPFEAKLQIGKQSSEKAKAAAKEQGGAATPQPAKAAEEKIGAEKVPGAAEKTMAGKKPARKRKAAKAES